MEKQRRPPPPLSAPLDGGPSVRSAQKYLSTIIIVSFPPLFFSLEEIIIIIINKKRKEKRADQAGRALNIWCVQSNSPRSGDSGLLFFIPSVVHFEWLIHRDTVRLSWVTGSSPAVHQEREGSQRSLWEVRDSEDSYGNKRGAHTRTEKAAQSKKIRAAAVGSGVSCRWWRRSANRIEATDFPPPLFHFFHSLLFLPLSSSLRESWASNPPRLAGNERKKQEEERVLDRDTDRDQLGLLVQPTINEMKNQWIRTINTPTGGLDDNQEIYSFVASFPFLFRRRHLLPFVLLSLITTRFLFSIYLGWWRRLSPGS